MEEVSGGLLSEAISVKINRLIFEYDQILICGPVFPHEVVGFSGGNKYLFPGISGQEMIDQTHWLGALLGSYHVIGTESTPVRELIDRAAAKTQSSRGVHGAGGDERRSFRVLFRQRARGLEIRGGTFCAKAHRMGGCSRSAACWR